VSRERTVALRFLELTAYELGSAAARTPGEICPLIAPTQEELREGASLADQHDLTPHDAAYPRPPGAAALATLDRELLRAGLAVRRSELAAKVP
jgi:hypothetical protein